MDLVFKALADDSRRELLDRLRSQNGQTLSALCTDLAMTRQAVTKHLVLLEKARLVTTKKQGREKFHFLNPEPLRQISAHWIDKYERLHSTAQPLPRPVDPEPIAIDGESRWINLHTL